MNKVKEDVLNTNSLFFIGYRELGLKHQLLRTLHFETMVYEKMKLPHLRDEALRQIRNLQNKVV